MVCLVGAPGSLLASQKESCVVMVVAVSAFNFLGWIAHVIGEVDAFSQVQLCRGPKALQWFYITGEPLPLLHARDCSEALPAEARGQEEEGLVDATVWVVSGKPKRDGRSTGEIKLQC